MGKVQKPHHDAVKPSHKLSYKFRAGGRDGPAPHSPGNTSHGLSGYHAGAGNIGPKFPGEKHPVAHPEVHHASRKEHKHEGHHGEHKMLHSHKVSERPMGAFRFHEVMKKGK